MAQGLVTVRHVLRGSAFTELIAERPVMAAAVAQSVSCS